MNKLFGEIFIFGLLFILGCTVQEDSPVVDGLVKEQLIALTGESAVVNREPRLTPAMVKESGNYDDPFERLTLNKGFAIYNTDKDRIEGYLLGKFEQEKRGQRCDFKTREEFVLKIKDLLNSLELNVPFEDKHVHLYCGMYCFWEFNYYPENKADPVIKIHMDPYTLVLSKFEVLYPDKHDGELKTELTQEDVISFINRPHFYTKTKPLTDRDFALVYDGDLWEGSDNVLRPHFMVPCTTRSEFYSKGGCEGAVLESRMLLSVTEIQEYMDSKSGN